MSGRVDVPLLTLNNGVAMPQLGLGVWQSTPAEAATAVTTAIDVGYRLIDTASAYQNEEGVGQGIRASGVDRSDLFITTKLWLSDYAFDRALEAFDRSLDRLGLDYLDLWLLHWPVPLEGDAVIEAYRAAERMLAEGRVRAIGVCNHTEAHLEKLMAATDIAPTVNQIEMHPYFVQKANRRADTDRGIVTQAWSPIGGSTGTGGGEGMGTGAVVGVLDNPVITALSEKYSRSPAQIVLRWHIQHGNSVIPKSVDPVRIRENIDVFDFVIDARDMTAIDGLDTGTRGGPDPELVAFDTFRVG